MKKTLVFGVSKLRDSVPDGAASVGLGIAVASIAAYAFVVITLNSLDGGAKAAFSAFWAVIFVIGPGFFLPMEQEVGRAVAHRRAQGDGSRPLVYKAFKLGAGLTAVLIVATVAFSPLLSEEVYNGDQFFTVALAVSLVSFFLLHLSRGVLAGEGRFRPYAEIIAIDAIVRLAMVVGLVVAGVTSAGIFALCIGLAPLVALPLALRGQRQILQPGSDAPFGELSKNLGWLLAGSVFMQALAYSPLLGVNLLGGPEDEVIVAGFASAFFIARIPILAFGAIQGVLLPKLAGLAGSGQKDEFKSGLEKLLVLVIGIAIAGTVGAFVLGPTVGKILFKDFTMGASGLALLAAGSGVFIIALTLAQALMALGGHRTTAIAWGLGLIVAIVCMSLIQGLELRVDLGFLLGGLLATAVMFPALLRRRSRMDDLGVGALVEAIEHEPIEI